MDPMTFAEAGYENKGETLVAGLFLERHGPGKVLFNEGDSKTFV